MDGVTRVIDRGDQFQFEPVGIGEREHFFSEAHRGSGEIDVRLGQLLYPGADRFPWDRERSDGHLAVPVAASPNTGPWKECQNRSGPALGIAVIKVIRTRIIEIHGLLDETETHEL